MSFQFAVLREWNSKNLEPALKALYADLDVPARQRLSVSRVVTILRRLSVARDPSSAEQAYVMLLTEVVRALPGFGRLLYLPDLGTQSQGADDDPVIGPLMANLFSQLGPAEFVDASKIQPATLSFLEQYGSALADIKDYTGSAAWWVALSALEDLIVVMHSVADHDIEPDSSILLPTMPTPAPQALESAHGSPNARDTTAQETSQPDERAFVEDSDENHEGEDDDGPQESSPDESDEYKATPPPKPLQHKKATKPKRTIQSDPEPSDDETPAPTKKKSSQSPHAWRMSGLKLVSDRPAHKALGSKNVDVYTILQQPEFHGIRSIDLAHWKVRCLIHRLMGAFVTFLPDTMSELLAGRRSLHFSPEERSTEVRFVL